MKNITRHGGAAAILGGAMYVLAFVATFLIYFAFKEEAKGTFFGEHAFIHIVVVGLAVGDEATLGVLDVVAHPLAQLLYTLGSAIVGVALLRRGTLPQAGNEQRPLPNGTPPASRPRPPVPGTGTAS